MENNKSSKKTLAKKIALVLLAVVLIVGATISGTLAWLSAKTDPVVNTFVVGNVGTLALEETDTDSITDGMQYNYTIIPGDDIEKDPKVTYTPVTETDKVKRVPVYVFVKIEADGWINSGKTYTITGTKSGKTVSWTVGDDWTAVTGHDGVYYKAVAANESLSDVSVIKGNTITVDKDIVSEDVAGIAVAAQNITFTAYAIQQSGTGGTPFTAADAWTTVQSVYTSTP